jgi:hypothetical protein
MVKAKNQEGLSVVALLLNNVPSSSKEHVLDCLDFFFRYGAFVDGKDFDGNTILR